MQMLSKNGDATKKTTNEKPHVSDYSTKKETSAFLRENGIGEKISIDSQKSQTPKNDIFSALTSKNPMFALCQGMQNDKSDMSSMLHLLMSLMQKQKNESQSNDEKNAKPSDDSQKCASSLSDSTQNPNENRAQNRNDCDNQEFTSNSQKQKTQREIFSPVAFAGYEVMSSLCSLVKKSRRPCR